jgi:hypothetical protein
MKCIGALSNKKKMQKYVKTKNKKGVQMTLSDHQWEFLKDVAKLIQFAEERGIKLTAGEMYRTNDQQILYYTGHSLNYSNGTVNVVPAEKRSWTMNSNHLRRLAVDFNFFIDGELTYNKEDLKEVGSYWVSLNPSNRWGGNFSHPDVPHFERNV